MANNALSIILISTLFCFGCNAAKQSSAAFSQNSSSTSVTTITPEPNYIDFNVKDVRLGDTKAETVRKLGKPLRRHLTKVDNCSVDEVLVLTYEGINIQLDRGPSNDYGVLEIHVFDPHVQIEPGIKIGDREETVREKLGEPYVQRDVEGEELLYYLTKDDDNAMLVFRGSKLAKVRLYINPC